MNKQLVVTICKWVSIALVAISTICTLNGGFVSTETLASKVRIFDTAVAEAAPAEETAVEQHVHKKYWLHHGQEGNFCTDSLIEYLCYIRDDLRRKYKRDLTPSQNKKYLKFVDTLDELSQTENFTLIKIHKYLKEVHVFHGMLCKDPEIVHISNGYQVKADTIKDLNRINSLVSLCIVFVILTGIVFIVLHILDNALPGVLLVLINIIALFAWKILMKKYGSACELNKASIWALILSIIAMLIWIFRMNISSTSGSGKRAKDVRTIKIPRFAPNININKIQNSISRPASINKVACNNCGNVLRPGSKFCNICGTKYEEPAVMKEFDVTSKATRIDIYCQNCGTKLDDDAIFCDECGCRRS